MEAARRRTCQEDSTILLGRAERAVLRLRVPEGQALELRVRQHLLPLWAGIASREQARAVVRNLPSFEQPGGIVMSRKETKAQWDFPYGWAPIQLLAVEGLRRYGYNQEADRIAQKFLAMVAENFRHDGTIREKYNVVTRSSETQVELGYKANIVGFGWTNGVFVELLNGLQPKQAATKP